LSESTLYIRNSNSESMIDKFKAEMMKVFETLTDLGEMSYFLGMEVQQNQREIFIC